MKQLEGWDIKLIKKIKSSLTLKIFLMMALVLIIVGVVIYNRYTYSYKNVTLSNYTEEIKNLVNDLEKGTIEDATNKIYDFCLTYSANAQLTGNEVTYKFGEVAEQDTSIQTISSEVTFTDSNESYILSLSVSEHTVNQIMNGISKDYTSNTFTNIRNIYYFCTNYFKNSYEAYYKYK